MIRLDALIRKADARLEGVRRLRAATSRDIALSHTSIPEA
jgi:hypothetical protein